MTRRSLPVAVLTADGGGAQIRRQSAAQYRARPQVANAIPHGKSDSIAATSSLVIVGMPGGRSNTGNQWSEMVNRTSNPRLTSIETASPSDTHSASATQRAACRTSSSIARVVRMKRSYTNDTATPETHPRATR